MRYTVRMYSRIKRLRRNGERKSDRDIGADPGIVGHVTLVMIENTAVMKIHAAGDDGSRQPMIPEIYRAKCVTMHGDKMLFKGLERVGEREIPQEWSIQIMQDQPAEMAQRSHRPG